MMQLLGMAGQAMGGSGAAGGMMGGGGQGQPLSQFAQGRIQQGGSSGKIGQQLNKMWGTGFDEKRELQNPMAYLGGISNMAMQGAQQPGYNRGLPPMQFAASPWVQTPTTFWGQ